jgi:hypothetical protein
MQFFSVSNSSFDIRGFPWIDDIVEGFNLGPDCNTCGSEGLLRPGKIEVTLDRHKGTVWPDVLGCGAYPLFIVSGRVLQAWEAELSFAPETYEVKVVGKLPKKLGSSRPPDYHYVNGKTLEGVKMDFAASGYVDIEICPECGTLSYNIGATDKKQNRNKYPHVFLKDSWAGKDLFTPEHWPYVFFCTEKLLQCATKFKLTNFRFTPTEEGNSFESKGVRYL